MNNQYYFNPWEDVFLASVRALKGTLVLVSPNIKFNIIKKIMSILPQDEQVKLIVISSFTKKNFKQKKSDLDLFDYLVNFKTENFECQCYSFKNLDSNIYMFNENYMYIGSSSLSKQGLNKNHAVSIRIDNIEEVKIVKSEILQLIENSNRILDDDIVNMRNTLYKTRYASFKEGHIEDDKDPVYITKQIEETITSSIEENEIGTKEQISYNQVIDDIKQYKDEKNINTLNHESFLTINISTKDMTVKIQEDALHDFNILREHIKQTFSNIVPIENNNELLSDITNCFIHPTWQKYFTNFNQTFSPIRKDLLFRLGKSSFSGLLAISITKSRLFQQGENQLFDNTYKYIQHTYPYLEALESIKCDLLLSAGDIVKNSIQTIFLELLGTLFWHLEFNDFEKIFLNYFDYSNEYVYDEYKFYDNKTLLQELTQKNYGLPRYTKLSENGPDHKKIFEYQVEINTEILGRGIGDSKKNAQEVAAKNAVKFFIKKYSYIEKKVIKNYRLKPYNLSLKRMNELRVLNSLLPKPISNLSMLDVAFSHISIIKIDPSSRSHDALSFLGSRIEQLVRQSAFLFDLDDLEKESLNKFIQMQRDIKVSVTLESYFDAMKFKNYLKSNLNHNKIPISIKSHCIQALIALFFLEHGLDETISFIKKIWSDFKLVDSTIGYTLILQEHLQGTKISLLSTDIEYRILLEKGKDNQRVFEIGCYIENILYGKSTAKNKKEAKRLAAKETLNNPDFKRNYSL